MLKSVFELSDFKKHVPKTFFFKTSMVPYFTGRISCLTCFETFKCNF